MPAKSPFPDRREVLAATAAVAASSLSPRQRTQRPQATKSARSRLMSRKTSASSCAGTSWLPAGLSGKRSRITHKACRLRAYHKLILLQPNKGGHFAAWEQPQLFSEEVRAGFRPLRT
jgi:hypothetical protein